MNYYYMHRIVTFILAVSLFFEVNAAVNKSPDSPYSEQVYINTHSDLVLAGEFLYISLFCVDASTLLLSDISKNVYIELIDPANDPVIRKKMLLNNGIASGRVKIDQELKTGNYYLRAYTRYQKNLPPDYYGKRIVSIVNTLERYNHPENNYDSEKVKPIMNIYPEAGYIVEGEENSLIIDVKNGYDRGVRVHGDVTRNDSVISVFQTNSSGLVKIGIEIDQEASYTIRLTRDSVPFLSQSLEKYYKETDLLISTQQNRNNYSFFINSSQPYKFTVNISSRLGQFFSERVGVNGEMKYSIKKEDLHYGLNNLYFTDNFGDTIFKKVLYRHPEVRFDQNLTKINDSIYQVDVNFDGASFLSDFSNISATLAFRDYSSVNVANYLLLQYPLRFPGRLYDLMPLSSQRSFEMLDLYLSTKDLVTFYHPPDQKKHFLPSLKGMPLTGKISARTEQDNLKDKLLLYSQVGRNPDLYMTKTNDQGEFKFNLSRNIHKDMNSLIQVFDTNSSYYIKIDQDFENRFNHAMFPLQLNQDKIDIINKKHKIHLILSNKQQKEKSGIMDGNKVSFYGKPDEIIYIKEYIRLPIMEEVFIELLKNTYLKRSADRLQIRILDKNTNRIIGENPLILLDGVPIFEHNLVFEINPEDIYKIEQVSSEYFLNNVKFDGILSLFTVDQDLRNVKFNRSYIQETIEGPLPTLQFDKEINKNGGFNHVVYFDPVLKHNSQGGVSFKISKPLTDGPFELILEGISDNGIPFSYKTELEFN